MDKSKERKELARKEMLMKHGKRLVPYKLWRLRSRLFRCLVKRDIPMEVLKELRGLKRDKLLNPVRRLVKELLPEDIAPKQARDMVTRICLDENHRRAARRYSGCGRSLESESRLQKSVVVSFLIGFPSAPAPR